jgi:hypothetical protein
MNFGGTCWTGNVVELSEGEEATEERDTSKSQVKYIIIIG